MRTVSPSFQPSSLPPSDSLIPSLYPSGNVPIVQGIHMTRHADKCFEYFDNDEILLVSCNGNVQQDYKIYEDGRITALGGAISTCVFLVQQTSMDMLHWHLVKVLHMFFGIMPTIVMCCELNLYILRGGLVLENKIDLY